MWKLINSQSNFFYLRFYQQFINTFNYYYDAYRNLLVNLSIEGIYNLFLEIAMCINQIKLGKYISENRDKNLGKNPKIHIRNAEKIHKLSKFITICRGTIFNFLQLTKPLVTIFLALENFNKESVIKGLSGFS